MSRDRADLGFTRLVLRNPLHQKEFEKLPSQSEQVSRGLGNDTSSQEPELLRLLADTLR